jgi:hypothetical protein
MESYRLQMAAQRCFRHLASSPVTMSRFGVQAPGSWGLLRVSGPPIHRLLRKASSLSSARKRWDRLEGGASFARVRSFIARSVTGPGVSGPRSVTPDPVLP